MRTAVAFIVAAVGFYASVAWAGDTARDGAAAHRAGPPAASAQPHERQVPAATPAPKSRASSAPSIPTLRTPARTGREVICACGPIDRHA